MKTVSIPSKIIRTHKDGIVDTYHVRRAIGKGGFATVYEVLQYQTDQKFAIKAIPLANLKENGRIKRQLEEINIQTSLNHPNILRSYDYFKDTFNLYMVLELCPYNTVYKLLKDKGKFSELDAADIIKQVLEGVKYLHENSVIHRDIKLQNLLIGSDGKIKISDFGISIKLSSQAERCYSTCGTYGFMPPEMLNEDNDGYSFESDIWSIGVCAFLLLTGQSPFLTKDKVRTERLIRNAQYRIPPHSHLSFVSKDFIRSILQANPENRPSIDDLLQHPFITYAEKTPHQYFFQALLDKSSANRKTPEQQPQLNQEQQNKQQEQINKQQELQNILQEQQVQLQKRDRSPPPNQFAQSLKPKRPKLIKPSPQKQDQLQKKIILSTPNQHKRKIPVSPPPQENQFNRSCRHRHPKQLEQLPESPEKQKKRAHRRQSPKKEQIILDEKIPQDGQEQNNDQQPKINEVQDFQQQPNNKKQNQAYNQQQENQKEIEENQPLKEKAKSEQQNQKHQKQNNQENQNHEQQIQQMQNEQNQLHQVQQIQEIQNQDKQITEQQNQLNQEQNNQEKAKLKEDQQKQQQNTLDQSKQENNKPDDHQNQQDIFAQSCKSKRMKKNKQSDLQASNNQENPQPDQSQAETIKKQKKNHSQKHKSPSREQKSTCKEIVDLVEKNDENNSQASGHSIPSYSVIRFCNKSKRGDLYYFMKNGQVGMISHDHQRLVLDPFGEFIQMWPNVETNVPKILNPKEADKVKNISKLLKYEKAFKETNTHLLEIPESKPQKGVPMRHVKYWMGNDSGLLFRMDNRVIQVNFQDKSKLIVFWEQKSLISTHSLFENGSFITFSNLKKSKDSELKRKYSITKKMVDAMNKGDY